jgi:hypothetical protein
MQMSGYSGTPLAKKLGIKANSRLLLLRADPAFTIDDLPEGVTAQRRPTAAPYDTILLFATNRFVAAKGFEPAAKRLTAAGGLWMCWPKKSSGLQTDLTEADVRTIGLDGGLVDNKVCAVDETWSGLRFVRRLSDR